MSDYIERDGKKYFEEVYLQAANTRIRRHLDRIATLEAENARLRAQVADLEQAHDSQRIAIAQAVMSKRNEHASWGEIIEEIKMLREYAQPSAALDVMWDDLEADRKRLDWLIKTSNEGEDWIRKAIDAAMKEAECPTK